MSEKSIEKVEEAQGGVEDPEDQKSHEGHEGHGGVKTIEAITSVWSRKALFAAYAFILLSSFVNSLQLQTTLNLTPYVVSDFSSHELIAVTGIASSLLSGTLQIPTAKIMDVWGRAEGFAAMVFISTLGFVLMAICRNVATYAAAQVFSNVGFVGISYVLSVVVADTSKIENRGLALAISTSPYIVTAFIGPISAQGFFDHSTWRWAFGCFAICIPITSLPLFFLLWIHQRKALKTGVLVKEPTTKTFWQLVLHWTIEFDVVGVTLLSAGLVLFFLPFSLESSGNEAWKAPRIITELTLGGSLLVIFGLYEKFLAPIPYIPYKLFATPTVLGANLLSTITLLAFFCWDNYFTSFLQVVNGLDISEAGYVANIYTLGSTAWSIVVGLLIRATGRYKWIAMAAMPIQVLGGGLMIYFRHPNINIGLVVMCQILIAFSYGALMICQQVAVMAVAAHDDIAVLLALLISTSAVGSGIGTTISGAIWTNTMLEQLVKQLPEYAIANATQIYGDLSTQLSYPFGDPVRTATIDAYGVTQQRMCIASTAVMAVGFIAVLMWKDVNLKDMVQVKGMVF